MQKVNQVTDRSNGKVYTVGDSGTFSGHLIGEKLITITGTIIAIIEADDYAIIRIETESGPRLLRI